MKTHLATALGINACCAGFRVRFCTAGSLAAELSEAIQESRLSKLEKSLRKFDLLIIDELSYLTFSRSQSELLFQVISERSERASLIITTNLEFSQWTQLFENEMMVAALVDRVTFHSQILNMNCTTSYRMEKALNGQPSSRTKQHSFSRFAPSRMWLCAFQLWTLFQHQWLNDKYVLLIR